jgi:hypothetical protein
MLLANPKTLAAMEAKQNEAEKNKGKGSAKKGAKTESNDPVASLPSVADLLQLSADSSVQSAGLGSIDFASSPVQQQQSKGTELLMAPQSKEVSPPPVPVPKPKGSVSPTRLTAAAESPAKLNDCSPHKKASKAGGREKSSSPSRTKGGRDNAAKASGNRNGDAKDALAQAAEYTWNMRQAELEADIEREKSACASLAALVSGLRRDAAEAKQRLVLVESGSELAALQFAVSNLEQLLRQSEEDRVGLLQVSVPALLFAQVGCSAVLRRTPLHVTHPRHAFSRH